MEQCLIQSRSDEKRSILQFFGRVDNETYREYRVRLPSLVDNTEGSSDSGAIQVGLKRVIEQHSDRITELENELRHHQQMKTCWSSIQRAANDQNMRLLAKILDSDPKVIEEFETENFASDYSWTHIRKAKNMAELKSMLSLVEELDEDGNKKKKKEPAPKQAVEVVENVTRTYEENPRERIELTVKKQPDKKPYRSNENLPNSMTPAGNGKDGVGKDGIRTGECVQKQNIVSGEKSDNSEDSEEEEEKRDEELTEKWSETTSSEIPFPITDTSCSSLGSCEFEVPDEELHSPPPPKANDVKPEKNVTTGKSAANNRGKGKKGRKVNKGPKMTIEEIEAIKKKKKDDADRMYAQRQKELKAHLDKVEKTDRHRIHRRLAETALEILKKGSGILPPEIQELNEQFDLFVMKSKDENRFKWRDEYMTSRVEEVSRTLIGTELTQKLNLMASYQDVIDRTALLQTFLAFSATLHESTPEYTEFQLRTITLYLNGYDTKSEVENETIERNFEQFKKECLVHLSGPEIWSVAKEYVVNRLNSLRTGLGEEKPEVKFLKETYAGINHLMEAFKQCTNVAAFLNANKTNPSFNLMEAWFLESRKPPPLVKVSDPE